MQENRLASPRHRVLGQNVLDVLPDQLDGNWNGNERWETGPPTTEQVATLHDASFEENKLPNGFCWTEFIYQRIVDNI